MGDPNFRRTVLFISADDPQEGSFGLILNRPAQRCVGEVLPNKPMGALARVPVFLGGPVGTDQMIFAAFRWHPATDRVECEHHLVIEAALEALDEEHTTVRAFVGYAGWAKGQLYSELAQHAWLLKKPTWEMIDAERCSGLWREVTSSFGPLFKLAAEAPDDISRN